MKKNVMSIINTILAEISGLLLFILVLLLCSDVLFRNLGFPVTFLSELSVFTMVIVIFIGLAKCEEGREHVSVDVWTSRLSPRMHTIVTVFIDILQLIVISFVLYTIFRNAQVAYYTGEATTGIVPLFLWPVKFIMVIGYIFYLIQILLNITEDLKKL